MKQFVLLLAALAAAPAWAGNAYVTGAFSHAEQRFAVDGRSLSETSPGLVAAAGYRITPHFGLEVGYASFGEATIGGNGVTLWSAPRSYYGAVVGTYPLSAAMSMSAKLGAARTRTSMSGSDGFIRENFREQRTSPMFGIGVAYAASPSWALVLEYQHFGKIIKDQGASLTASMTSIGARYSF